MPETPPAATTAYICECGKKWVFLKTTAAARKLVRHPCQCGRTLVVGKGLIYSLPAVPELSSR